MVGELDGRWEAVRSLTAEVERAVAENVATPCLLNARSLLVCALASAHTGDEREARRLEHAADALGMEGYGLTIDAPRLGLALLRRDVGTVRRLASESGSGMGFARPAVLAVRLDALAFLRDRERVEAEAPALLVPNTYVEPFALRALGVVRQDEALLEQAVARFEALGLGWHAAQTRKPL